jgi:glycerol-3-phosphate dehydrogenase
MTDVPTTTDLLVIGGGINGAGIARDAAGRGLSVILAERDDLAAATSSLSSKLIHGGLRYLEQYEFRLVAEALGEREVLLNIAPHLVAPLRFVMPYVPELRPRWMIRAGLFLYDHLGTRAFSASANPNALPGSHAVDLRNTPYGHGIKPALSKGFIYSDCRVDDARLVLANAVSAREHGAEILTRTECVWAKRIEDGWQARLRAINGAERLVHAHVIVNAAGPWVQRVLNDCLHQPSSNHVRLVKGSHIVVPRAYDGEHAYILQNDDRRVVFMIPYEGRYTLIGTTDVAISGEASMPQASTEEIEYLCRAVNRYLQRQLAPADVVWAYAGIRPLYDDGSDNPSAVTRDYTLRVDDDGGVAPVLSVFGGKITTYRRLAEHVLNRLARWYPHMQRAWTAEAALPGGDLHGEFSEVYANTRLQRDFPWLPAELRVALARRHGSRVAVVLHGARALPDLGWDFGANLYSREIDFMIASEWACSGEDILYRRTKAGLHLTVEQRLAVSDYVARRIATP